METVAMFDVIPITGSPRNGSRFCLVCALGSAPVMVAFVQSRAIDAPGLLEALQNLSDKHKRLQVVVVVLDVPSEELRDTLRRVAREKQLQISLSILPGGDLPASLPVNRSAENTVLLYRGRRIHKRFENVDLRNFDPTIKTDNLLMSVDIQDGLEPLSIRPEAVGHYQELNQAAMDLASGS